MAVSDMPQFTVGERAVVFLITLLPSALAERRLGPVALPTQLFEVYGNFQGKLPVVEGRAGGIPWRTSSSTSSGSRRADPSR